MALALLGVDAMGTINGTQGYSTGDAVLAALGRQLRRSFTGEVLRGRWNGDQVMLAFPAEDASALPVNALVNPNASFFVEFVCP